MGVLSALIQILWFFCSMVLLSIFTFLCPPTWSHDENDENVDCPHLYHVIIGLYTLIVGALKYFLNFGGFVRFDSNLGLLYYFAFVHYCFSLLSYVITWRECWLCTPVSCDHGIVHLDCWSIKIFSHFYWFCELWFWSFRAFVLWCFCLFLLFSVRQVIAWREFWLSTPVLCDHMIVHLDFWSIKIFSHFWGFCPLWFWAFGSFVLWCFCPFLLFSVYPRHRMTRMLVVHTCIRWSWDRIPWLLEY